VFGDLAPRVTALIRIRPRLLNALGFAPCRHIHAIAAFLYLAADAGRPDHEVAAMLEESDPRDLLRKALPDAPLRLYRALDRAGDRVHQRSYYERLGRLCAGPLAEQVLAAKPLNDSVLSRAETLLNADPALLQISSLISRPYEVEALDIMLTFLRAHGVFSDSDLQQPKGSKIAAVVRRLQASLDKIKAPPAGFSLPAPFRIVESVGELREIGTILQNCVSDGDGGIGHWMRLADGSVVYISNESASILVALHRVGPGLWYRDEGRGFRNACIDDDLDSLLTASLQHAGVRLVSERPSDAFQTFNAANGLATLEDEIGEDLRVAEAELELQYAA
jgi:hypothetical protein